MQAEQLLKRGKLGAWKGLRASETAPAGAEPSRINPADLPPLNAAAQKLAVDHKGKTASAAEEDESEVTPEGSPIRFRKSEWSDDRSSFKSAGLRPAVAIGAYGNSKH